MEFQTQESWISLEQLCEDQQKHGGTWLKEKLRNGITEQDLLKLVSLHNMQEKTKSSDGRKTWIKWNKLKEKQLKNIPLDLPDSCLEWIQRKHILTGESCIDT